MTKGKWVIARTRSAGVFMGQVVSRKGMEIVLREARRLWYWDGAASLSQLSQEGVTAPQNCKFPMAVPRVLLTELIECLPVSATAKKSIDGVPVWKR
jgi:hypothetical protein